MKNVTKEKFDSIKVEKSLEKIVRMSIDYVEILFFWCKGKETIIDSSL